MKSGFNECLKIVMETIFGILLVIASYNIILNIRHYKSLSSTVMVSEIDKDYSKYKNNVDLIEEKAKLSSSLTKTVEILKKDGVFRLVPKTKLSYKDLYNLNDYFIEELINNNWVGNISKLKVSEKYQDIISLLINNSNYLNSVFNNNSLLLSDNSLDNKIEDNYHAILSNYLMYSNVIINICNDLGGENG